MHLSFIRIGLACSLLTAGGACVATTQSGIENPTSASPTHLENNALRALLLDAYVSRHPAGYDGPGEFFRANGVYQRDGGHGAIVAEGLYDFHDNAVCVRGDTFTRVCRRVVANSDGTHTFINTADSMRAIMVVSQPGTTGNIPTPLRDDALRALFADAYVHDRMDDGPGEFFQANGAYQRHGGRGGFISFVGRFEIRDNMICVTGEGSVDLCRRVVDNGDGTHTFINTADVTSAVMIVTRRAATGHMTTRLQDDALRTLFVDVYVPRHPRMDDGPTEFFHANGVYQRNNGWAVEFEGRFEIRGGAICVRGDGFSPLCRRISANGDGTYTFVNVADGTSVVTTIIPLR